MTGGGIRVWVALGCAAIGCATEEGTITGADTNTPPTGQTCGPGTVASGDQCVPEEAPPAVVCGEGTELQEGACVLIPEAGVTVADLGVAEVAIETGGGPLRVHEPVQVRVGLAGTSAGPWATEVLVGLAEKGGSGFCVLGAVPVASAGGNAPAAGSAELVIPPSCLSEVTGSPSIEIIPGTHREMNAFLKVDPYGRLGISNAGELENGVLLGTGGGKPGDVECDADPGPGTASCAVDFQVEETLGLDFVPRRFAPASSVLVLETCPPPEADETVPKAYRCNSAIVKNAAGDYVYGRPDLQVDLAVWAFGAALVGPAGELVNVLDEEDLDVTYDLRPAANPEDDWQPLYLHTEGDPAKAGEDAVPGSLLSWTESNVPARAPLHYAHGLYVENDCGEKNKDTCDKAIAPRDRLLAGDWAGQTNFLVRACVDSAAEQESLRGNNCLTAPVTIIRVNAATEPGVGGVAYFNTWDDHLGSGNTIQLDLHAGASASAGPSGVVVSAEYSADLGGLLPLPLFAARADASVRATDGTIAQSHELRVFGTTYWSSTAPTDGFSIAKLAPAGFVRNVVLGQAPFDATVEGEAGFAATIQVETAAAGGAAWCAELEDADPACETALAAGGTEYGVARLVFQPFARFSLKVGGNAQVGPLTATADDELELVNFDAPIVAASLRKVAGDTGAAYVASSFQAVAQTLRGPLRLALRGPGLTWCKSWPGSDGQPCGYAGETVWDSLVAEWRGWSWNTPIWRTRGLTGTW